MVPGLMGFVPQPILQVEMLHEVIRQFIENFDDK